MTVSTVLSATPAQDWSCEFGERGHGAGELTVPGMTLELITEPRESVALVRAVLIGHGAGVENSQ